MAKLLVAVIAFSTLGFLAYRAMYGGDRQTLEEKIDSAPKRQLDNVHNKAAEIEANDQKYVDDVAKKAFGE